MPGSVSRPRRIACGAEEGILVLPILRVAHCTVRAIEADKPVPDHLAALTPHWIRLLLPPHLDASATR